MQRAKVGGAAFILMRCAGRRHSWPRTGHVRRGPGSLQLLRLARPESDQQARGSAGLWVSFPAGNASITVGGWSSIDLGQYDDPDDDISESGGTSAFNFAEFDPYAEVSFPRGKATLTGGVIGYIYPNDRGRSEWRSDQRRQHGRDLRQAGFDVPLSPQLSIYYDVDKIKGAYIEADVSHSLAAGEKISIDLGAAAGFSAGQGRSGRPALGRVLQLRRDGFTHLDLSAGVPFTAGVILHHSGPPRRHHRRRFHQGHLADQHRCRREALGRRVAQLVERGGEEEEAPAAPE